MKCTCKQDRVKCPVHGRRMSEEEASRRLHEAYSFILQLAREVKEKKEGEEESEE